MSKVAAGVAAGGRSPAINCWGAIAGDGAAVRLASWLGCGRCSDFGANRKMHQYMVLSVPSFAQRAANQALKEDVAPARDAYRGRCDYVLARLKEIGLDVVGSYRRCRCGRCRHRAAMFMHRSASVLRCRSWRFRYRCFRWRVSAALDRCGSLPRKFPMSD